MRISIQNKGRLKKRAAAMSKAQRDGIKKGVLAAAGHLEGEIKIVLNSGGRTGRVYKRGNKMHQASAPGEAPATDTGALVGSITSRTEKRGMIAVVGSRMEEGNYAKLLEYGTQKTKKRPFLKPTFRKNKQIMKKMIASEFERATRRNFNG